MRPSILDYFARDVAPTSPVVQHLPDQLVREAQDAGDDRVGASRAVARAVGRRAAAEHQASQAEHLLARRPPISRPGAARRFNTFVTFGVSWKVWKQNRFETRSARETSVNVSRGAQRALW